MKITKDGREYLVNEGYEWFWNVFESGIWEPSTFKIFDKFLDPERNFVDIGAWIGPTVLYASPKAKKVFAFEPDPVAFKNLRINMELNRTDNVTAYPVAVSNEWKSLHFGSKTGYGDSMSSELWAGNGGADVPAISLESVLNLNPNFIKIDIEGGEKFIFESPSLKYALLEVQPTIHLSLHTPWFKDDVAGFANAIRSGLSVYPYFYNENLEKIDINSPIFDPNAFTSIVATFTELK